VNHRSLPFTGLAPAALVALLAGCSGASGITPAGTANSAPETQSLGRAEIGPAGMILPKHADFVPYGATNPPEPVPREFMLPSVSRSPGVRPSFIAFKQEVRTGKKAPLNYVFTSDWITADINIYDEATLTLLGQGVGYGGWGVAADAKGHVCWGRTSGTIACGSVTAAGWEPTAYLTESSGQALGLAFTSNGDLYATNFPKNVIDHWSKAQVAGCTSCSPIDSLTVSGISSAYYLGADGGKLYVDGNSTEGSIAVGSVNLTNAKFKAVATAPPSSFFPGGIAFDKSHTLIWNNEFGYLYTLPKPYTYVTNSFDYSTGSSAQIYTGIALDSSETTLLAANHYLCQNNYSSCSDVQENSYPLGTLGIASATNGDIEDLGIAITPPGKD
jgi:hypothetical protein